MRLGSSNESVLKMKVYGALFRADHIFYDSSRVLRVKLEPRLSMGKLKAPKFIVARYSFYLIRSEKLD